MRICSPQVGLNPECYSGGGVHDIEVLKEIARLGVTIEIPLMIDHTHEEVPNWNVYPIPIKHYWKMGELISNVAFFIWMLRIWRVRKFDLVRVFSPYMAGPACVFFKKLTGIPVVAHYHHLNSSWRERAIDEAIIGHFDRITTVSEFSKSQLVHTYRVDPQTIDVVYNGVSSRFRPEPKRWELLQRYAKQALDNKKVLLYLGSIEPRKNLSWLLEIFCQIARRRNDVVLVLCGCSPKAFQQYERQLRQRVKVLGLGGKVIFTGYVAEREKVSWYNLADVFVSSSTLEGFGLSVAEAMACAKPVVALKTASMPEVVKDGETGFLVDAEDRTGFAERVLVLLDDPMLRQIMGDCGRHRINELFSWERTARLIIQSYERVLTSKILL